MKYIKKYIKINLFLLLFFISNLLISQSFDLSFQHITADQGLSQNTVYCILQDSEGFLWYGTQGGLNKYDGYRFTYCKHDVTMPNSLSDNWIFDIAEDKSGNLWIATNKGFNKLNKKTGKITRYYSDPGNPSSLSNNATFGIYIDNEGFIWIKTQDILNKLDTATGIFTHFEHSVDYFDPIEGDNRIPIIGDAHGLWVATNWGLTYFNKDYEQFIHYKNEKNNPNSISNNNVKALCLDNNGNLWVGTRNGLNQINIKTKKITRYFNKEKQPRSISDNSINYIYMDRSGTIWIGTENGGLNKYNPRDNTFSRFSYSPENPNSLSRNNVMSIYEDNSRNLWVGTFGGGLNKADTKKKKFKIYRKSSDENSVNLSYNDVSSFFIDDGIYWIGTWGGGLNIYNPKTGEIQTHTSTSPSGQRILHDAIFVFYKDKNNNIWIGTQKGINVYNKKNKTFTTIQEYTKPAILNITNRVNSILEDKNGNIWIGTERGLYRYNWKSKHMDVYYSKEVSENTRDDKLILTANKIYSIIQDRDGFIWIGTVEGLNKYDPVANRFIHFLHDNKSKNTLCYDNIIHVLEDSKGYIWIGTASGLNRFDKKDSTFVYFSTKDGLPDEMIYEIQEDDHGNIWFSTNRGIVMLNTQDNTIWPYNIFDGLQGWEYNVTASYKSKKGELFFGGVNGLNSFYPDSMKNNDNIPPVVITSIEKINNKGKQQILMYGAEEYVISFRDHTLTIQFAALEYTQPENNQYKYMMEGLRDEWIDLGNNNFVTFTNLPAGDYVFKVIGSNNDRIWNKKGAFIKITVTPPIWKTIWAYIAYVLIVFLIVYLIIWLRTQKLKDANQMLREKQLAALEIAKQKEVLSIKNKNITDSINYAKRIQEAMLPTEFLFKKLLPESFIFYKPKDIVSGDFYWITEKDNKIFISAVDCTGHGVPGAFMSIIGFDLLRNITKEKGIEKPASILNLLNIGVSETFSKKTDTHTVRDGMDISLCSIDKDNNTLEYAGAFNPLYLIRNNKIIEIMGNRFSVGRLETETQLFENHIIQLHKNDIVYLFTDGYPDQFGGPYGKKFKYTRFRHLLQTIHSLPVHKQKAFLEDNFDNWRGEIEQVDDILVIGTRIT